MKTRNHLIAARRYEQQGDINRSMRHMNRAVDLAFGTGKGRKTTKFVVRDAEPDQVNERIARLEEEKRKCEDDLSRCNKTIEPLQNKIKELQSEINNLKSKYKRLFNDASEALEIKDKNIKLPDVYSLED